MANDKININPTIVAYVVGGGIAYFGVIQPVLEKLGIVDSADAKMNREAEIKESAWSPTFWQQGPAGTLIINDATVKNFISNISDAFGVLWDNYDTIMGVFQQLGTKSQVSYLCDRFYQATGKGLYQFLV